MLLTNTPPTIGPANLTTTKDGPRPQTFEPSVLLLIVGSCVTGPTPQTQPFTGFLGDRNAVKVVGASPNGGTLASGCKDGLQTSGRTVRVITFQFSLTWMGMTGWICRMSCVPLFGPTLKFV